MDAQLIFARGIVMDNGGYVQPCATRDTSISVTLDMAKMVVGWEIGASTIMVKKYLSGVILIYFT